MVNSFGIDIGTKYSSCANHLFFQMQGWTAIFLALVSNSKRHYGTAAAQQFNSNSVTVTKMETTSWRLTKIITNIYTKLG